MAKTVKIGNVGKLPWAGNGHDFDYKQKISA
jgi:hypothetical protein